MKETLMTHKLGQYKNRMRQIGVWSLIAISIQLLSFSLLAPIVSYRRF